MSRASSWVFDSSSGPPTERSHAASSLHPGELMSLDYLLAAFREEGIEAQIINNNVAVRGPGHTKGPLELVIAPADSDLGYMFHSFAGDAASECIGYIERTLYAFAHREMMAAQDYWRGQNAAAITAALKAEGVASSAAKPSLPPEAAKEAEYGKAAYLWRRASSALSPEAEAYFASRGLTVPPEMIGRIIKTQADGRWYAEDGTAVDQHKLRYHPSPTLLFAARDAATDDGSAVQILRMPWKGKGPSRKIRGVLKGAAIKLTPHAEAMAARSLTVGEGFESCLAALMLGFENVWCLINADGIANLPVIDGIDSLVILGEHDEANRKAREQCFLRWYQAGRSVKIEMPTKPGAKDFNDELIERLCGGAS
ncbi:MAG: toprim domain-containing protein [Pseudomonadota bacterium]